MLSWILTVVAWIAVVIAGGYLVWKKSGLLRWIGAFGLIFCLGFAALVIYGASVGLKQARQNEQSEYAAAEAMVSEVFLECALAQPKISHEDCDIRVYATGNRRGMDREKVRAGLESIRGRANGAVMTQGAGGTR